MKSQATKQAYARQQALIQGRIGKLRADLSHRRKLLQQRHRKLPQQKKLGQILRPWLLAIALLLLWRLACAPQPIPPAQSFKPPLPSQPATSQLPPPSDSKPPRRAISQRPSYALQAQAQPTWLQEFKLQVAARAPKLALCLPPGKPRGILEWTCRIEPHLGLISSQQFISRSSAMVLSPTEEQCMMQILATPAYQLSATAGTEMTRKMSYLLAW